MRNGHCLEEERSKPVTQYKKMEEPAQALKSHGRTEKKQNKKKRILIRKPFKGSPFLLHFPLNNSARPHVQELVSQFAQLASCLLRMLLRQTQHMRAK